LYVKLILNLSLLSIPDILRNLILLEDSDREQILKNRYLGKFNELRNILGNGELTTNNSTPIIISTLENIFDTVIKEDRLLKLPDVARWDVKGKEICMDLAVKLLEVFKKYEAKAGKNKDLMFSVVNSELRDSLLKSYCVGEKIIEKKKKLAEGELESNEESEFRILDILSSEDLPLKIAIWDYIAGMTDSYIIREYESLTFKKVSLY